jgi:hypothetical protein
VVIAKCVSSRLSGGEFSAILNMLRRQHIFAASGANMSFSSGYERQIRDIILDPPFARA